MEILDGKKLSGIIKEEIREVVNLRKKKGTKDSPPRCSFSGK